MIRLTIYQETAHFRISTIGNPYLSYLLPPPSTIYGFLRKITNYESINYKNTQLSIQGNHRGYSLEKERLIISTKIKTKPNIVSIHKLHDVNWIIHIKPELDLQNKIINALEEYKGVFRLGRTEDLIIDFDFKVLDNGVLNDNICDYGLRNHIYLKWGKKENFRGQLFSMFLDSEVDENLNLIGYKPINLIYSSVYTAKEKIKETDGEYLISWIN